MGSPAHTCSAACTLPYVAILKGRRMHVQWLMEEKTRVLRCKHTHTHTRARARAHTEHPLHMLYTPFEEAAVCQFLQQSPATNADLAFAQGHVDRSLPGHKHRLMQRNILLLLNVCCLRRIARLMRLCCVFYVIM